MQCTLQVDWTKLCDAMTDQHLATHVLSAGPAAFRGMGRVTRDLVEEAGIQVRVHATTCLVSRGGIEL